MSDENEYGARWEDEKEMSDDVRKPEYNYAGSIDDDTKEELVKRAELVKTVNPNCHKCNVSGKFMVSCANEEGNACMTCMKCLFSMIIETGTEQFCNDNKEFAGMLFGYKDKFKT